MVWIWAGTDSDWWVNLIFLSFYLLTFEADEETEDHVIAGGEGGGDVEVESEAEAEGEPEGQAENSVSHVSEALPDVPHKPSGAHQEGVQM